MTAENNEVLRQLRYQSAAGFIAPIERKRCHWILQECFFMLCHNDSMLSSGKNRIHFLSLLIVNSPSTSMRMGRE